MVKKFGKISKQVISDLSRLKFWVANIYKQTFKAPILNDNISGVVWVWRAVEGDFSSLRRRTHRGLRCLNLHCSPRGVVCCRKIGQDVLELLQSSAKHSSLRKNFLKAVQNYIDDLS